MMLKDLRLAQDAAASSGASIPFGEQAERTYALLDEQGQTGKDFRRHAAHRESVANPIAPETRLPGRTMPGLR